MKIRFEIYNPEQIKDEKTIMKRLESTSSFREELLLRNPRDFGTLHINFYKHNFVIHTEMLSLIIIRHLHSIDEILHGKEIDKYQYTFEMVDSDYMMFNYVGNDGLRIRHYGQKSYYNNNDECIYVSCDYLKQEIIVDKQEYIEKMLDCATRFISFRELINDPDYDYHLTYWKNKVTELKKRVDSLK